MDFEEVASKSNDKSSVWHYFKRSKDKNNAQCKICQKILKCIGGSTSGLLKHVKNVHQKSLNRETSSQSIESLLTTEYNDGARENVMVKKTKLTDYYESDTNPSMQLMISSMTAKDGCAFRLFVESKYLRMLFKKSGHDLPTSATAIRNIMLKESNTMKQELINEIRSLLSNKKKMSISFDEWTSLRNRRYICLNLHCHHFSGNNFRNLGLIRVYGSLPATKCVEEIRHKLNEFGVSLETDVVAETTDGCSMMVKLGRSLDSYHQLCLAHALQLAIVDVFYNKNVERDFEVFPVVDSDDEDDLSLAELAQRYGNTFDVNSDDDADDDSDGMIIENCATSSSITQTERQFAYYELLEKVKKIVNLFRKSPTKNDDILQKYVIADFKKEYTLTNDCKTRWGSLAQTLERFLKLRNCINKALIDIKSDISFTESEWTVIKELYEVLDIFRTVSEALCRRDATLVTAEVAIKFWLAKLSNIESPLGSKMFTSLKKRYLERRLIETSTLKYLQNPETYFNNENARGDNLFGFIRPSSNDMCNQMVTLLKRTEVVSLNLEEQEQSNMQVTGNIETETNPSNKDELNAEIQKANRARVRHIQGDLNSIVKVEMALFENGGDRGIYLSLAYDLLQTIPPTSVEPERIFSAAGLLCTKIRSGLSDTTLDALIFLRALFNQKDETVD